MGPGESRAWLLFPVTSAKRMTVKEPPPERRAFDGCQSRARNCGMQNRKHLPAWRRPDREAGKRLGLRFPQCAGSDSDTIPVVVTHFPRGSHPVPGTA